MVVPHRDTPKKRMPFIGIAPSKTLAKVANKLAKKGPGVMVLDSSLK
jgi:hypothetical protein